MNILDVQIVPYNVTISMCLRDKSTELTTIELIEILSRLYVLFKQQGVLFAKTTRKLENKSDEVRK